MLGVNDCDAVGDFAVGWRKIRRIGADVLL
jgi:hypothetical protein